MQIVPDSDRLLIEAQVQPQDVELLHEGLEVIIRFPALPQRSLPTLKGHLLLVGADRQTDERSGMPYFKIRVAPDSESLAAIADRRLVAGMPAEVTIATGQRTAARYLVEPLMDAVRGAMRER
jgi:multidrug efflux pump subunit AcrA (membrane-fusion protein)